MKEKKNIDRIFQEKFKDFEMEPNDKVWDNIASKLDKKNRKKPILLPLWFKIGGVAAVLGIILASLLFTDTQETFTGEPEVVFENPEKSTENEDNRSSDRSNAVVDADEQSNTDEKTPTSKNDDTGSDAYNKSSSNSAITGNDKNSSSGNRNSKQKPSKSVANNVIADKNLDESKDKQNLDKTGNKQEANSHKETLNETSDAIAQSEKIENDPIKKESSILEEENALAEVEKKKEEEEETEIAEADSKKMRLSTFAAPVFYKNVGSGNELSNRLSNNETTSEVTFSYGMKIAYNLSEKLRIRTGISKIDINKNTQDISYSPSARSVGFENISPVEDNIEIRSNSPSFSEGAIPNDALTSSNSLTTAIVTPGEINQQFGYIEVPLELEYALIDKKFGLNIIGGGSSLFLDNNSVQLVSGEIKTDLGEATNINNTSFSTNIGIGMDYEITDKFSINIEPIFKYQINTFERVDNVQPINFGVYSGLSFTF